MMRLVRRFLRVYQGFAVSAVLIIFCLVGMGTAVIPAVKTAVDLYGKMKQLEKEIDTLSAKRSFLESVSEEDLREELLMLLTAVPEEKSVPTVLSTVEGLALATGTVVDNITITSPGSLATGSAAKNNFYPFTVSVSGAYDQVRSFVSQIDHVRRFFSVTSFDLSFSSSGSTKARLSLQAYHQSLPMNVGSVSAPIQALTKKEEDLLADIAEYPDVTVSPLTPSAPGGRPDPFGP